MRRLFVIPDHHAPNEAGIRFDPVLYEKFLKDADETARRFQDLVRETVRDSRLDLSRVKFFMEGIPAKGVMPRGFYAEVFPGIRPERTENPLLHKRASEIAQTLHDLDLQASDFEWESEEFQEKVEQLLKEDGDVKSKREVAFISNINGGLGEGEIGVLVVGAGHCGALGNLDRDIVVELFDHRLREWIHDDDLGISREAVSVRKEGEIRRVQWK